MIKIENMENWTAEYFALPENQKKAEKACERYDRLMVKNIRKMILSGQEQIAIADAAANDPGKVLEKARYEFINKAELDGQIGKIKVDLVEQKAEFIAD
ncbi:MAG: hypothetical protein IJ137_11690 [Eubacterium sp.]|nr:hypothetical protein [Eubacterium sp.]